VITHVASWSLGAYMEALGVVIWAKLIIVCHHVGHLLPSKLRCIFYVFKVMSRKLLWEHFVKKFILSSVPIDRLVTMIGQLAGELLNVGI